MQSKINGPTYDVLVNFEERWLKASKPHGLKKMKKIFDDNLLRIERIPNIMAVSDFTNSESDPEGRQLGMFRYFCYLIMDSHEWLGGWDLSADNLIPMEIALKIASKIKAKERFDAYIVMPMWLEGVPTGAATERILNFTK
ncbi:hypothetical protein V6N13_027125 [Hibiscus sabdariffa]|uniref:Uncharacterized protein n=2 Tax=Hibiscus sabdariffa TaxID=183260 RepID=A0ABR1ZHW4_9ROSI